MSLRSTMSLSLTLMAGLALLGPGAERATAAEDASGWPSTTLDLPFPQQLGPAPAVTWPVAVIAVRAEPGEVSKGERKVRVVVRVANGSDRDHKVNVEVLLLDRAGEVLASEAETDGVEEGEVESFSFGLRLDEERAATIAGCEIVVATRER